MTSRETKAVWAFFAVLMIAVTIIALVGIDQQRKAENNAYWEEEMRQSDEATNRTLATVGLTQAENGMVVQQ